MFINSLLINDSLKPPQLCTWELEGSLDVQVEELTFKLPHLPLNLSLAVFLRNLGVILNFVPQSFLGNNFHRVRFMLEDFLPVRFFLLRTTL